MNYPLPPSSRGLDIFKDTQEQSPEETMRYLRYLGNAIGMDIQTPQDVQRLVQTLQQRLGQAQAWNANASAAPAAAAGFPGLNGMMNAGVSNRDKYEQVPQNAMNPYRMQPGVTNSTDRTGEPVWGTFVPPKYDQLSQQAANGGAFSLPVREPTNQGSWFKEMNDRTNNALPVMNYPGVGPEQMRNILALLQKMGIK